MREYRKAKDNETLGRTDKRREGGGRENKRRKKEQENEERIEKEGRK